MTEIQTVTVKTETGYSVPLMVLRADQVARRGSILILPALGVAAKFYLPLADSLASAGFDAIIFEQRGHGASALRASRHCDFGFKEWLEHDIPASLGWIETNLTTKPIMLGHSLGGHLAACYVGLHPHSVKRLILLATGTPWQGAFSGRQRFLIQALSLLIPPMTFVLGYYDGRVLGFGHKEASQLMRDWRAIVPGNHYSVRGISQSLDSSIGCFAGQLLCVRYSQDDFAPSAAVEAVLEKFSCEVRREVVSPCQIDTKADHFSWMKKPAPTVSVIDKWLS